MKGLGYDFQGINYKNESLAGLTVAIALVPEAIAFSFIAGVPPLVGLYAAFIMGLVTALLGGRPGMISGATGAIAIVLIPLVKEFGVDFIYPAIILGGLFQMAVGALRLGKFIRLIPYPVMLGFVNGLAIVIFKAQFSQFKVEGATGDIDWISGNALYIMIGLVLLTMAIMHFLPKVTKIIPSGLAAILIVSLVSYFIDFDIITVGDQASIKGGFPSFILPHVEWTMDTLIIILPFALKVAGVGLIESLLTLTLIDDITETRGSGNRESIAQGLANVICGFFGSMGGCAMIGQSMINIQSGARKRLSGIVAAISLLLFIVYFSGIIEKVPIAALVGVMFMVAIGTFEWASLRVFNKMPLFDVFIIVIVSLVTVFEDLAVAVVLGVVLSAVSFAWNQATRIRARKRVDEDGVKYYEIYGPLFFASTTHFTDKFDVKNDPENVIVDFSESKVVDMSAIETIKAINRKYHEAGKKLIFKHLSNDCKDILSQAKVEVSIDSSERDPNYKVTYDA